MQPITFSYRYALILLFGSGFSRNCKLQPLKDHVASWGGFTALQHTACLDVRACHLADSVLLNFGIEGYQNAYVLKDARLYLFAGQAFKLQVRRIKHMLRSAGPEYLEQAMILFF